MAYTIDDLEQATAALALLQKRWENYDGNNPNKYRASIADAQARVATIEASLKASGEIPLTDHEVLERDLDRAFPEARSREIVEHEGKRYQRRFSPVSKSLSGKTVKAWHKSWVAVP